jgi:MFS transporter, AAHS family, 4-hydroxybenzoate transporter
VPQPRNIASVLDDGAWAPYQKFVLALSALAFLMDGVANQALGLAVPSLMVEWNLPRESFAGVTAVGLIGLTIGAIGGGVLGDRFGRRIMLVGSVLLFGVMTLAASMASDISTLFWLRLFDGLGIGAAIPNGAAIIAEFTPFRRRPLAIAIGMVFIALGSVFAGLIASAVLPALGWSGLFLVLGLAPIAIGIVFLLLLPESPIYLSWHPHRKPHLLKVMSRCGLRLDPETEIVPPDTAPQKKTRLSVLFRTDVRSSTIALWIAFFFCLLASYTMFSWVPAMLASLGFPLSMTSLGMTAFSAGGVFGGIASGWLIEKLGSRPSVLGLSACGVAAALLLGGLIFTGYDSEVILFSALAFEGIFLAGMLNGLYTLSAFIYPNFARATGVGAAAGAGRVGAIASSYTGVLALEFGGATAYFGVIAISIAISFLGLAAIRSHIPASSPPAGRKQQVPAE